MKVNTTIIFHFRFFVVLFLLTSSENHKVESKANRDQYLDLLNLNNTITFFIDLGAWHTYSISEKGWSFTGSYLL
jgi:hypothetical protein